MCWKQNKWIKVTSDCCRLQSPFPCDCAASELCGGEGAASVVAEGGAAVWMSESMKSDTRSQRHNDVVCSALTAAGVKNTHLTPLLFF